MGLRWQMFKVRVKEHVPFLIAQHLPRKVVYFAAIRMGANATTGRWGHLETPQLTFFEALDRWEKPHEDAPPSVRNCLTSSD